MAVALGIALSLLLTACRPLPRADLVVLNGAEPSSLDPLLVTGIEELRAVLPLFEGLTRPDPKSGRAIPALATHWTLSSDGRSYLFHLRTNAQWSTGESLDARDIAYSWRRTLEPTNACQYANLLFPISGAEDFHLGRHHDFDRVGIQVLDPHRLRVDLAYPCAYFLELCAFQTLAAVPRNAIEQHGDGWILAQGTPFSGPYQLEFWRINDRVRLRRNSNHWDAANTHCEVVDLLSVTAPNTVLNLYLKRQADVILDKPLIPTELIPELRKRPDYRSYPVLGSFFLRLNVTRAPFNEPKVRQAFALATDKEALVQRVTASGEEPAQHLVPTVTANYRRGPGQSHDPAAARRLLQEAGYPGGQGLPPIEFLFDAGLGGPSRINERVAIELKAMWQRELGASIELRRMEKKAFLVAQRNLDYGISRSSWIGDYNDPTTFLDLFMTDSGNNRTGWSHVRYDELLRAAAAEPDLARRADALAQAETLLVRDESVVIPLWFEVGFALIQPETWDGFSPNPLATHPLNALRRLRPP